MPAPDSSTARIVPVILAGGQGTRLWPLSRAELPKQFLALNGPHSLLQETLLRVQDIPVYADPIIVTHQDYRFLVAEQAREIGATPAAILLEPEARNTAAAIAAAAVYAARSDGAAILNILPSDHRLVADQHYRDAVETARGAAAAGFLVTFGIRPTHPETGFGYISIGPELMAGVARVNRFIEKPTRAVAEVLVSEPGTLWNSGMFMFSAASVLDEMERLAPELLQGARAAVEASTGDLDFVRLAAEAYAGVPSISIDHAVMEHSDRIAVVPAGFDWSDLGNWEAVWSARAKDDAGNVVQGTALLKDVSNSLVHSDHAAVVVSGLDGVSVIATADAVYVAPLARAQEVGQIVGALAENPETAPLTQVHRTSHRPWGGYTSIASGIRFQVKRLFVHAGKQLSLQLHHHRAEHWVVVQGSAEVTIDGETRLITENQSVYIPLGAQHRLKNPGKITLELIEVQTGSYLGEDDIIRVADQYGRQ